jgi:protein translocase SecG subunit
LNTITVISQIVLCILSVAVVVAVLLQKPNDPNMSAAFGQGGGSYSKSVKSRSAEGKLNTIVGSCYFATLREMIIEKNENRVLLREHFFFCLT